MRRLKKTILLLGVYTFSLGVGCIDGVYGAGMLAEMTSSSMLRRVASSASRPVVVSTLGCRHHSNLQGFQPGFYTQATEDPIFKRLMLDDEVQVDVTMPPLKKAYQLIESSTLPDKIRIEYEEAQKKRFQVKHYVADEKSKSKAEGKMEGRIEGEKNKAIEIARKMLLRNRPTSEIIEDTGLTEEEINDLK